MKTIEEYIIKHGKHFTENLAITVSTRKWSSEEIRKTAESMVYYNVTKSTFGDIIYLTNKLHSIFNTKKKCIKYALSLIGDIRYTEFAFDLWIKSGGNTFDYTDYI